MKRAFSLGLGGMTALLLGTGQVGHAMLIGAALTAGALLGGELDRHLKHRRRLKQSALGRQPANDNVASTETTPDRKRRRRRKQLAAGRQPANDNVASTAGADDDDWTG